MLQFSIGPTLDTPAGNAAETLSGSGNKRASDSANADQDFADYFASQDTNKDLETPDKSEREPSESKGSEFNELIELINGALNRTERGNLKLSELVEIFNGSIPNSKDATKLAVSPEDAASQKQQFITGVLGLLQQVSSDPSGLGKDIRESIFGTDDFLAYSSSSKAGGAQEEGFVADLIDLLQQDKFDLTSIERQLRKSISDQDGFMATSPESNNLEAQEKPFIASDPRSTIIRSDGVIPSQALIRSSSERISASEGVLAQNGKQETSLGLEDARVATNQVTGRDATKSDALTSDSANIGDRRKNEIIAPVQNTRASFAQAGSISEGSTTETIVSAGPSAAEKTVASVPLTDLFSKAQSDDLGPQRSNLAPDGTNMTSTKSIASLQVSQTISGPDGNATERQKTENVPSLATTRVQATDKGSENNLVATRAGQEYASVTQSSSSQALQGPAAIQVTALGNNSSKRAAITNRAAEADPRSDIARSDIGSDSRPKINPAAPLTSSTAITPNTGLVQPAQLESELEHLTQRSNRAEADVVADLRGISEFQSATRGTSEVVHAKLDLPRHISQQLAEAFQRTGSRQVELHLNPIELGRVKISLQTAESGVSVHIWADRPETLELMRRNMDVLAQDFREIGYKDAQFSFAGDASSDASENEFGTDSNQEQDVYHADNADAENTDQPVSAATQVIHLNDRLDIRV